VPAVVSPALPSEGQWRVLTPPGARAPRPKTGGTPAGGIPDATQTSYLAAVAEPEWTSFSYYVPGPTGAPAAAKLLASMQRPANRYESTSTRDFLAVLAR
jgi:hypothetical protein